LRDHWGYGAMGVGVPGGEALASNVTTDLYRVAKKWLASLDPGGVKLEDYHSGLLNAFGFIQIMGMPSARKLENIYVGLRAVSNLKKYTHHPKYYKFKTEKNIVDARKFLYSRENFSIDKFLTESGFDDIDSQHITHRPPEGSEDYEQDFIKDLDGIEDAVEQSPEERPTQVIKFVNDNLRLIVLGQPGSGKTTLLKYLALVYSGHLATSNKIDFLLPIFVPLREIKRVGSPTPTAEWLRDLAVSCAADISNKTFGREWLEDALEKGKCLILLDGVDEAPTGQLATIFQSIKSFSSKYRRNKIVITCRAAAFDRSIEGFQICEIDDFNKPDIELFISQWYGDNVAEAKRLTSDIFNSTLALDLCRTPLLLTLICVLYGYRRTIPANRAELYEACVDALLFRWDTFRSVDREPLVDLAIGPERKKLLLSRVAYRAFDRDVIYFKKDNLAELVQAELDYLNFGTISADVLIKEIESHSGLFVEYTPGVYCFSHLTFHEFFTALYFHDTKEYADLFNKVVREPKYMEVFLMCIEKVYNADQLVMPIISHVVNSCISSRIYNEYFYVLIAHILQCDVIMNQKLRTALNELLIKLEQLDIDDQSLLSEEQLRYQEQPNEE
jgi:energy-coupling factor transporter ATP-binding protein EcfA2